ncbi:MAG: hypothetical protein P8P77_08595 [Crocinitomicaceae bacterium]|nr:hypothetical protein [Crocinitomicaceae bacterium]
MAFFYKCTNPRRIRVVLTAGKELRNGVRYSYGEFSDGSTKFKLGVFAGNVAIPIQQGHVYEGQTLHFAQKPAQALAYLSLNQISNSAKVSSMQWYANGKFVGTNNAYIYEPGVYDVEGVFTFDDSSLESITNRMYLGFDNDVDFAVHHFLSDLGELKLWMDNTNNPFDSIQWPVDDQYIWTGQSCSWTIPTPEKLRVKANVFYHNGANAEKSILVDGSFQGRFIENFSVFELPLQDGSWDNTVGLEVVKDDEIYRTFDVSKLQGKDGNCRCGMVCSPSYGLRNVQISGRN